MRRSLTYLFSPRSDWHLIFPYSITSQCKLFYDCKRLNLSSFTLNSQPDPLRPSEMFLNHNENLQVNRRFHLDKFSWYSSDTETDDVEEISKLTTSSTYFVFRLINAGNSINEGILGLAYKTLATDDVQVLISYHHCK